MAKEAKHMSGPWIVADGDVYRAADIAGGDKPEALAPIAHVYGATCEEQEGNARLIAAAPELLAALEAICTAFAADKFCNPVGLTAVTRIEAARAAIRKARRESVT